jgi:hypothetical protein
MTHATYQIETIIKTPNSNVRDLVRAIFTSLANAMQSIWYRNQQDAGSILQAQNRREVARRNVDNLLR